ncbi:MAG: 4-hydroxybenzoate octaprenyltransferase [Phycisphaerae bacterium]|nr:4-hydroxybenzoate octaprenyltransferase [Phycisphaerae bacterium]
MTAPARHTPLFRALLENIKFAHTIFALPFALIGMFLAAAAADPHHPIPPAGVIGLILVCMVTARSSAMTANRIMDLRLDARNPRTCNRPMVTGQVSRRAAWLFLACNAALFLAACLTFLAVYGNPWPLVLAAVAMVVLCGYPLAKHFTILSHFWLGLSLGLAPVGAWVATDPASFDLPAIVLMLAVTAWTAGFDILYACQDLEVDRREGLHAIPARLGVKPALLISRGCHVVTAGLLVALGLLCPALGWIYGVGAGVAVLLLGYEQSLVRPDDLSRINVAFFTVNGLISVILALFVIVDVFV